MIDLHDLRQIKKLLKEHGFKISKSLGQNFLTDGEISEKIAASAGIDSDSSVLEIGPGLGTLTRQLAMRAKHVVAVEIDRGLYPILNSTLSELKNVQVVYEDFLKLDIQSFCSSHFEPGRLCVVSNLPYYITTKAMSALLFSNVFSSLTVTIQKEVADKLIALPGEPEYCLLSAYTAYFGSAKKLFSVPAHAFFPQPGVHSETVKIDTSKKDIKEANNFISFAKASFANRRKTLENNLLSFYHDKISKAELRDAFFKASIDGRMRAEDVPKEKFHALFAVILQMKQEKKSFF